MVWGQRSFATSEPFGALVRTSGHKTSDGASWGMPRVNLQEVDVIKRTLADPEPSQEARLLKRRPRRGLRAAVLTGGVLLLLGGTAVADLVGLPLNGAQVNSDPAAGINPALNAKESDVTGGSLAGGARVPWAVFRQQTSGADQIFSRSFANGVWTTRGSGTVGGRSSASPTFSGSLNFDQGQDGEAPTIDFAGAGRAVPWATWYEDTPGAGFGQNNIFASRFDNASGKWIFAGQGRGTGGIGNVPVPSLNIHTDQSAENPSVAGGSAADATKPGPWVTWQETDRSCRRGGSDLRQPPARPRTGQLRRRHPGGGRRCQRARSCGRRVLLPADRGRARGPRQ